MRTIFHGLLLSFLFIGGLSAKDSRMRQEKKFKVVVLTERGGRHRDLPIDYPSYHWTDTARKAFIRYIDEGWGGWIGFHHAALLGEFDGFPMWKWFSDFMGHGDDEFTDATQRLLFVNAFRWVVSASKNGNPFKK